MRRALLPITLALAACGPIASPGDAALDGEVAASLDAALDTSLDTSLDSGLDAAPDAPAYMRTYLFTMDTQAFPDSGHPGALVHIPPGFAATEPFGVAFYVHGFENCIQNTVEDTASPCTPGLPPRTAHHLISQFDALHLQALLVLPEVAYDQRSGDPGRLGLTNGLRDFLEELFSVDMASVIGPHHVGDLGRVVILSHSGGYKVAAMTATVGGVPQVREIDLLDSLYGSTMIFDQFVMAHVAAPAPGPDPLGTWRFASVYTDTGGTATNNVAMAMRAQGWVASPELLLWDDTYATLGPADYVHPLLFKRSELSHDGVPRYYFSQLLAASGFAMNAAPDAGIDP